MLVREICMATTKDRIGSDVRHFELFEKNTGILVEIMTGHAQDLLPLRSDGYAARHADAVDCCLVLEPPLISGTCAESHSCDKVRPWRTAFLEECR